jgi:hypothetical protein
MLTIALTIDIDADVFDQSLQSDPFLNQEPGWTGLEQGVPMLTELFGSYKSSDGSDCVATWFVRADDQVGYYFEDNAYLFSHYKKYWDPLSEKGHEIAWHPHLYRFHNETWIQQTDPEGLNIQLQTSFHSIGDKGWNIKSSRIGEAYFSNNMAQQLVSLGILCDSTALPGRERKDDTRSIDWLISPERPYYPSVNDYRIPGEPHTKLLEIPFSMAEVLADYDKAPLKRYIDLSFWHRALKDGLHNIVNDQAILTTIVHPSTVVAGLSAKPHGLLSYSMEEVRKNLDFIIALAKEKNIEYRFKTISQVRNDLAKEQHG